ncbi:MAG: NAD-dependent epimerase/dehydratase family protein [Aquificaceae bacterium]
MKTFIVSGCAGFIGARVCELLLKEGYTVIGFDNLEPYYDIRLKQYRLEKLQRFKNFSFLMLDLTDRQNLFKELSRVKAEAIIHLAAAPGVRHSIENPGYYLSVNTFGTLNLLELAISCDIGKFVFASTSSVYAGENPPFLESSRCDRPLSPYASSKRSSELICYNFHYLHKLDISILRLFTVYGPAGRPDMGVFRFIKWAIEESPIRIFGSLEQRRDFTYIDDVARAFLMALKPLGFEIINIGNAKSHSLGELLEIISKKTGKRLKIEIEDFKKGDMNLTHANVELAKKTLGWEPQTSLEDGIEKTVLWFRENWDLIEKLNV